MMMDTTDNTNEAKPVPWPPTIADPLAPVSVHFAPPNEGARRRYEGALRRRPLEEGLAGGGGRGKDGEVSGWVVCLWVGRKTCKHTHQH